MNKEQILKKLGSFESVEELQKNQFVVKFEKGQIFQSYKSIVAVTFYNFEKYFLGSAWSYSRTTGKYRNIFLNNTKEDVLKDIKNKKAIVLNI